MQALFLGIFFFVFWQSEGSEAPHHVLRIAPRGRSYPIPRRAPEAAWLTGVPQTELIAGAQFYKAYALRSERSASGAGRIP